MILFRVEAIPVKAADVNLQNWLYRIEAIPAKHDDVNLQNWL